MSKLINVMSVTMKFDVPLSKDMAAVAGAASEIGGIREAVEKLGAGNIEIDCAFKRKRSDLQPPEPQRDFLDIPKEFRRAP